MNKIGIWLGIFSFHFSAMALTTQLIEVRSLGGVKAELTAYEIVFAKNTSNKTKVFGPWQAVVGRNGIAAGGAKREGDGKTPSGRFNLEFAFGKDLSSPGYSPYYQMTKDHKWIDDVDHKDYNKLIVGETNAKSFEQMLLPSGQYDLGLSIGYNRGPIVPGLGSAIFLHIWKNESQGTAGCVALSKENVFKLLKWMKKAQTPQIEIIPDWTPAEEFTDISALPNVKVDLRYATTNNFTGKVLYHNLHKAYLHRDAFAKLKAASEAMSKERPDLNFLVFDALRPRTVQEQLFSVVKGTPQESYVANPEKGSVHNYGFALDLSLLKDGVELDMGTPFDSFKAEAQPKNEEEFVAKKVLTVQQIENRKLLKKYLEAVGFHQITNEWWHFDGLPLEEIKKSYKIVE